MELLLLIPVLLVIAPIILGLFMAVAVILLSLVVASSGFFFFVANEVAHGRMPAYMLLFAFGLMLVFIPLVCLAVRGAVSTVQKTKSAKSNAKLAAAQPAKARFILPGLIGLGFACVVGAVTISALTHQPFWPALRGSHFFQRAEPKSSSFSAADVQTISVRVHNDPISVRVDENATDISVHYNDIANYQIIRVELQGDTLTVREGRDYRWVNFAFYVERSEIVIVVPSDFLAVYILETSNGRVTINGERVINPFRSDGPINLNFVDDGNLDDDNAFGSDN